MLLQSAAIVLAGWGVFSPVFHGGWLSDDTIEITENSVLRERAGLWNIWFSSGSPDYYPLKSTVQWVQWHLWREHVTGYHLTNVGLHLLSAFLLWHLLRKLGVRQAWLGGLLFVVHPLVVESVAWISELKNTLSLPPLLLAMSAFVDYDQKVWSPAEPGRSLDSAAEKASGRGGTPAVSYILSLLWFLAAMLCKSSVVMFPAVLLLYGWWKRGRLGRKDLQASAAFFAVSLILGWVTVVFQQYRAIGGANIALGGFFSRVAGAGFAVGFYFCKFVLPVRLMFIYPRWTVNPASPWQFLPLLVLGATMGWLWTKRANWGRHALFGLGCFLVNLAPVLGFIPMSYLRFSWVADHFAYLPIVGLIGLAVAGFESLRKLRNSECEVRNDPNLAVSHAGHSATRPPHSAIYWCCAALVIAAFAFESRRYARIFTSEQTLWTYTVRHNPKAWAAHNNLGLALADAGRLPEAMTHYERALQLKPDYFEAHINLGNALLQTGRTAEAIAHFEQALRLSPDSAEPHNNLGDALRKEGRIQEAIGHYKEALRLKPGDPEVHYNLGILFSDTGRPREAIAHYERALRLKPDFPQADNNLGVTLAGAGQLAASIVYYERALRLKPDYPEAENNLGLALAKSGRLEDSIAHFEAAVRLSPAYSAAHQNLGVALRAMGRTEEALDQLEQAARLNQQSAAVYDGKP